MRCRRCTSFQKRPSGTIKCLKTRQKKVVTLDIGAFRAKETIMQSEDHGKVYNCQELKRLTPHRCTFGYDVIVHVGYALFVRCRSEKDIVEELARKNISISDREVSFLGKKFVTYLAVAHREARQRIRSAMDQRGGYILHVDGTCEGDSPHLFTGLDGITEIVLDNIKIPSERSEELLIPFFEKSKSNTEARSLWFMTWERESFRLLQTYSRENLILSATFIF